MAKDDGKKLESPERRDLLKTAGVGAGVVGAGAVGALGVPFHETGLVQQAAAAERVQVAAAGDTPIGPKWWPSEHGAEDQAGASNRVTPSKVMQAVKLIKEGKLYRIGRDYEAGMPLFGSRAFALRVPGTPTGGLFGKNRIAWMDEFLAAEIGQVGTQFDGLGHIACAVGEDPDKGEIRFYNGFPASDVSQPYGLAKLGVEHVKPFFTRGIIIDCEGLNGGMLDKGTEVTVAMIKEALAKQGMSENDITEGDAVFFHTGWGSLWMENNDRYNSGEPGPGVEAAKFLAEKKICLVGADCWGVEVVPNPDANLAFPAHQEWIVKHGIYIHENLDSSALKADGHFMFAYIFTPVPIKGATGSPGSPIAAV